MSILNLSNYKSSRYNAYYLKLLPVASRERPPQAKEFEDIQDICINNIQSYSRYNFNSYEILSGLKVLSISNNSITLSSSRILLNEYPVIIETEQITIESTSSMYTIYIVINITKQDNTYTYSYSFNTEDGYPLIQCNNSSYKYLVKDNKKDYIKQQLFEIYGNFIKQGLTYKDSCITPGIAYIKGNKIVVSYHTPITTNLNNYKVVINEFGTVITYPTDITIDLKNNIELGSYIDNRWIPNLYNKLITNKDICLLQSSLNYIRDYLLETALLKPIDTTSNLITDTFNNSNNADTSNILFDCDIEQGNLILNKFSRITNDIVISNLGTNTKVTNSNSYVIVQDYTETPLISQLQFDSFITTSASTRGVLKLGPTKLDTSIYKRTSDKTIVLTQTLISAEAYGLTPNSSDFRLSVGAKLISTIIKTDSNGKALFSFSLPAGCSANDVITVQNNTSSATSSLQDTSYSIDNTYVGQTFSIDNDDTTIVGGSLYIRRVTTTNPTIKVLITRYNNQVQEVIGQTIVENTNIKTSVDGSLATSYTFDLPITLSKGQYALVITSLNGPIDLFISNSSTLVNSNLIAVTDNKPVPYLNKDLKFELYKPIYTATSVPTKITVTDNIDKFDYIYYPGKFKINSIEYINEAPLSPTNTIDIVLDVSKYSLVYPILISTNKTISTYISRTIRTNFSYTNIYLELDGILPDSTTITPYISSNQGYTWERLTTPTSYLVDGNDQTFRYVYNNDLSTLTNIINEVGNITQATRNYLTIRIDLETKSDNKPIVKGYKGYTT